MRNNNPLLKLVAKVFLCPFYLVGMLIQKNDKVWVFGSLSGNKFSDNSKYLYEFVSKKQGYVAVWLTKNVEIIESLKKENKLCYHYYSLRGIYYAVIAKFIFLSYSYDDVSFFCYLFPQKTKIIQLFHGTPLKKLEIEVSRSWLNQSLRSLLNCYMGKKYDLIIAASEDAMKKLDLYFNIGYERYLISGYPRNDVLFHRNNNDCLSRLNIKKEFDKIVFYLPTYREYSDKYPDFNLFDRFGFNEDVLDNVLRNNNAIFLIKLHPRDYDKAEKIIGSLKNKDRIYFVNDDQVKSDIYPLLSLVDVLITDYSSVYFDFLLLNRPVIFSAFDRNEYESSDRGFYFDYDFVTPGASVENWNDLCEKIDEAITKPKIFASRRLEINNLFNKYTDGNSSARIFNYLTGNK